MKTSDDGSSLLVRPIASVTWGDAWFDRNPTDEDGNPYDIDGLPGAVLTLSVGYVLKERGEGIWLDMSLSEESPNEVLFVPRGMIQGPVVYMKTPPVGTSQ